MSYKNSKVNVEQEVWDKMVELEKERKKDPNYVPCCDKNNPCCCNTFSPYC